MKKRKTLVNQRGFIAFITMLIIGAVVVIVTLSVGMQGVGGLKNAVSFTKNAQVVASTKGCADTALLRLRYQTTYAGENLQVGEVNCVIQVTNLGSNQYQIRSEAVTTGLPSYKYVIVIKVRRNGYSLNLLDWQESTL